MIIPVILSGGTGSRLWPFSREQYPKQLLALAGSDTLLQTTVKRLEGYKDLAAPIIVCNEEHRFLIAEQLREIGVKPSKIVLEPDGRNTAPALTAAASFCDKDSILLVMPADHLLTETDKFFSAVNRGVELAQSGQLVTFGVIPSRAETGYGYIKKGDGSNVSEFVEKPDYPTAIDFVESGEYLWNSGIFMMRAGVWNSELGHYCPEIHRCVTKAVNNGSEDNDYFRLHRTSFLSCPGISIDYAVMEKANRVSVVPIESNWSDIGAWSSLWDVSNKDEYGNVISGDVLSIKTQDSLIMGDSRLVTTVGISRLIVAETADAILVANIDNAQDIKSIVDKLKKDNRDEVLVHRRVYRPWGYYEVVDEDIGYKVKQIGVNPKASLSLQRHAHRAEHWVVVKGTATVTCDERNIELNENESTYIPIGALHRLENNTEDLLKIVEIQTGDYLGEDDIKRIEDVYNRAC